MTLLDAGISLIRALLGVVVGSIGLVFTWRPKSYPVALALDILTDPLNLTGDIYTKETDSEAIKNFHPPTEVVIWSFDEVWKWDGKTIPDMKPQTGSVFIHLPARDEESHE